MNGKKWKKRTKPREVNKAGRKRRRFFPLALAGAPNHRDWSLLSREMLFLQHAGVFAFFSFFSFYHPSVNNPCRPSYLAPPWSSRSRLLTPHPVIGRKSACVPDLFRHIRYPPVSPVLSGHVSLGRLLICLRRELRCFLITNARIKDRCN